MEEFDRTCSKMKWLREGSYELPQSRSEIEIPEDHILLVGKDAIQYRNLIDCIAIDEAIEAVVFSKHEPYDSVIFKSYHGEGYISSDDWDEMNAQELLKAIMENTEEANRQRLEQGIAERVEVIGWLKEPTRDISTNTVYWAIEAQQGNQKIANSVALKLGRYGYEQLTWVTPKSCYKANGGELDLILAKYHLKIGSRYEDFVLGDKVASYSITGLVANVAGAKLDQATFLSSIILFIKRIPGLIFAACAAVAYSLARLFKKRKESALAMNES